MISPAWAFIPYAAFLITLLSGAWYCPTESLLARTMAWMIRKSFLDTAMSALILSMVNVMGLTALQAAYREGQEWLDQLLIYLEANRDFVYDFVRTELPGLSMAKPEGTYLAWIDCRGANLENPYEFFLDKAKVALSNGISYGTGGQGFVRLNFGCPRSTLEEALLGMKTALL